MTDDGGQRNWDGISYLRRGLRIEERYHSEVNQRVDSGIDLLRICAVLAPRDHKVWLQRHTLLIDLNQKGEELSAGMDRGTRYEVRRAASKDNLSINIVSSLGREALQSFCDYYDEFARQRSLALVFRARLEAMANKGRLVISSAADIEGRALVQHAYFNGLRAHLLYSASLLPSTQNVALRGLIGRANRLLHWQDMLYFKQLGMSAYDFGGIDVLNNSEETTRISQFKEGFGGKVVESYNRTVPCTYKGRLALLMLRIRGSEY